MTYAERTGLWLKQQPYLFWQKSRGHLGHQRGRLIPLEMKQMAIELINEAVNAGARQHKACAVLGISCRTMRRWQATPDNLEDKRGQAQHHRPQALTEDETQAILEVCNTPEFASLPPTQIVPQLADQGIYLASESSFYRILKANNQVNHRGKAQPPRVVPKPLALVAYAPNEVWSWDSVP